MATVEETRLDPGPDVGRRIPTPMKLQIRRLQYSVVPVLIFAGAALWAAFLWQRHMGPVSAVGEVAAVSVPITAPADGALLALPREVSDRNIEKFDRVRVGDVIAKMDDTPFINQLQSVTNELDKLRPKLEDKQKQHAAVTGGGAAGGAKGTATQPTNANAALKEQLRQDIAALEDQIRFNESQARNLTQKIAACTIRSPVAGTVTSIAAHPGTSVRQGREIMTITEDQGQYIVSYVRQNGQVRPKKDMLVDIRIDRGPGEGRRISRSRVQEVGNQIEAVPPQQLANPRMPEWGVPVRIAMPSDVRLRPGEVVGLVFRPELSATVTAGAAGASATD